MIWLRMVFLALFKCHEGGALILFVKIDERQRIGETDILRGCLFLGKKQRRKENAHL